jgi:hypothetical protein
LCGFDPDNVKVIKGQENLVSHTTGREERLSCKICSSKVYAHLHHLNHKAIYLDMFTTPNHGPDGKMAAGFAPTMHIMYTSGNTNVQDGLPKYVDLPAAFGGSDKTVPDVYHKAPAALEPPIASCVATCLCGACEVTTTTAAPKWVANCHCSQCRRTMCASYATLAGFDPDTVNVTKGAENLVSYTTGREERFSCKTCNSKVYAHLHHLNHKAIYADMFTTPNHGPDGKIAAGFAPTMHIMYTSGNTNVQDGLPKYVDLPAAFGGSDKTVPDVYHKAPPAAAGGGGKAIANAGSLKVRSWFKTVDGNGLALAGFAFSTFMFFAFLCDIDEVGVNSDGKPDKKFGIHFLCSMLSWGVSLVLVIAGLAQGIQGDHLGFTSYIFHAGILGSIGYQFRDSLNGPSGNTLYLVGYFSIVAGWFDLIFTIMAFRIATVFGILYFTVAVMFILVGLNFTQKLSDVQDDPTNVSGDRIAGISCIVVTAQCLGLLWPVLTGVGGKIFALPNPIGKCLGPAPGGAAEPEEGVIEHQTQIKLVDANGLALMAFGFSTFQFAMFLLNVDGINWGDDDDASKSRNAILNLEGMLIWGVAMCLTIAGIFQFFNGDALGFTSYIFHAAILGTTGWWLDDALEDSFGGQAGLGMWSFFYYFAFWVNMVFTLMAFRLAKMFGILYFTVGVMFLIVGLNWADHLDSSCNTPGNPSDCDEKGEHTGDYFAGVCCLIVACQCFYLLIPVMTGKGVLV